MQYRSIIRNEGTVRLAHNVILREEHFGGIVLNANSGDILELDHEAFKLLTWLRHVGAAGIVEFLRNKEVGAIIHTLLKMEIVENLPEGIPEPHDCQLTQAFNAKFIGMNLSKPHLSAPETVHLAITYRCNNNCIDCYSRRHMQAAYTELDTSQMCSIIDKISDTGVFQLAIGGGEPFLRTDLGVLVEYAVQKGLLVHVTTGQYSLNPKWTNVLKHVKSLHIGIRSEEILNNSTVNKILQSMSEYVINSGVSLGANLIMTRFTINNIEKIIGSLLQLGFKRVIFLRYKPTSDIVRWNAENPRPNELRAFRRWLANAKLRHKEIMFRVDCAASFLMRDISATDAIYSGIKGCAAGDRIVSVSPDGSVYPCSQLVGDPFNAGNILKESFREIWHESKVLDRYRNFRKNGSFLCGVCGKCDAAQSCGGCRIYADDHIGSELSCPMENNLIEERV